VGNNFVKPAAKTRSRFKKLKDTLQGKNRLLIVMQDNPDPDSIGAAVTLRRLANVLGNIQCTITHGGSVGRGENRALVRYLDLNLRPIQDIDCTKFDFIAVVDAQPGTGNCSLPVDIVPDIVIDHHSLREITRKVKFVDIRVGYGAASTIMLEYLIQAGITPDIQLATALLYAIRSDTQDLGRQASRVDIEAVSFLFPLANQRMVGDIQRGSVPRIYFRMLDSALRNARIYSRSIISDLGQIDNPDMIAEVADLLLREDETYWTMCTGLSQGKLHISVRTSKEDARADRVIHKIVARKGTGGGHQTYAGGQIPLDNTTKSRQANLEKLVHRRFLKAIGDNAQQGEQLI
jgi:nanoRNase/pAp phosphatase (c-di-AMP/oligoRNAs hydrolase)